MNLEKAQKDFNKRMKTRSKASKNLGEVMRYISKTIHLKNIEKPTAKRDHDKTSKFKSVFKSKAKSPKWCAQLNFERG